MRERSCGTGTRSIISLHLMASLRCLLGDGLRGEGLGIPSLLLGCHSSCLKQEWFWRVRSSSWCSSSRATWSVVGFFWLLGASVVPASSGLQFVVATWGEWILQVTVWRMGAFERRPLASAVDVSVIVKLKFQQSFVEFCKVPQLQFIDRVVVISVASKRQDSQWKLCQTGDSTAQFLAMVFTCLCCACRDSAANCGLPAVAAHRQVWITCQLLCSDWCRWSRKCSWMDMRFGQLIIFMMTLGYFCALYTCTFPGAVPTGTRPPKKGASCDGLSTEIVR